MDQVPQAHKIPDEPSPPVPSLPVISADTASKALQDYFLANVDRGDNVANDELVDALVRRIRAQQASSDDLVREARDGT